MPGRDLTLLKMRHHDLQIIVEQALESYRFIGTYEGGKLVADHAQLFLELESFLKNIRQQLHEIEQRILHYEDKLDPGVLQLIFNLWTDCEKFSKGKIEFFQQLIDGLKSALLPAHRMHLDNIINNILACFQSSQSLNEIRNSIRSKLLQNAHKKSAVQISTAKKRPSCFISYSWGDLAHTQRVHDIAWQLKQAGIDVKLDVWDNKTNSVPVFLDHIEVVDFVVVVGTPLLVKKWKNYRSGGESESKSGDAYIGNIVPQELERIAVLKSKHPGPNARILCLLLDGEHDTSFPSFLSGMASSDLDFRNKQTAYQKFFNLLSELNQGDPKIVETLKAYQVELHKQYTHLEQASQQQLLTFYEKCQQPAQRNISDDIIGILDGDDEEKPDGPPSLSKRTTPVTSRRASTATIRHELAEEKAQIIQRLHKTKQLDINEAELQYYIPVTGCMYNQSSKQFDLHDHVIQFLQSQKKVLLLLGNSGAGKTLFLQHLTLSLMQENHQAKLQQPIVLYIPLGSFTDPSHELIEKRLRCDNLTDAQIKTLKDSNQAFIFILDAYDEMQKGLYQNIYASNHLDQWNAHVIFSCRSSYLINTEDYRSCFAPSSHGHSVDRTALVESNVLQFCEMQITDYIKKYVDSTFASESAEAREIHIKQYHQAITELPGLKELITTPFLLRILMEALPKIIAEDPAVPLNQRPLITIVKLYEYFVGSYFNRQRDKLLLAEKLPEDGHDVRKDFAAYSERLAYAMWKKNMTHVEYRPPNDLFGDMAEQNPWENFFGNKNSKMVRAREGVPIRTVGSDKKDGSTVWGFVHYSLQEYFVSLHMYNLSLAQREGSSRLTPAIRDYPSAAVEDDFADFKRSFMVKMLQQHRLQRAEQTNLSSSASASVFHSSSALYPASLVPTFPVPQVRPGLHSAPREAKDEGPSIFSAGDIASQIRTLESKAATLSEQAAQNPSEKLNKQYASTLKQLDVLRASMNSPTESRTFNFAQ